MASVPLGSAGAARPGSPSILYLSLNQDQTCLAVGTTHGFNIFSLDPLKERFHKEWGMGIGIVEMLMRCNILALVGGGVLPKFPKNQLIIWDDFQNKAIAELEFSSDVKGVKLRREIVAAVLQNEVHIYHFNNLNVLTSLYSVSNNEAGLCAISGAGDIVLGVCGLRPGMLHLERVDPATSRSASVTVQAHKNDLSCLGISPDGTLVATASSKGTLIRVFDTATGTLQREFRRGTHPAPITSLNFAADNSALVASSGSGTIHVFDMLAPHPDVCERGKNRDRSAIRFHTTSTRSISCFGSDSSVVIVVGYDGKYSKYSYFVDHGERVARSEIVDADLFHAVS